ncbi:hypothetical protein J4467_02790 [Candidatus Woesearchaeota archaeon]|nr:hypothetical protein [Candidatus Woesearchaeota archaeon]
MSLVEYIQSEILKGRTPILEYAYKPQVFNVNFKGISQLDIAAELKVFSDNNDKQGFEKLINTLAAYFPEEERILRTVRYLKGISKIADGIFASISSNGVFNPHNPNGEISLSQDWKIQKQTGRIYTFVTENLSSLLLIAETTTIGKYQPTTTELTPELNTPTPGPTKSTEYDN